MKIILVLVRENSPKRFSHPAYSCSHSVLFTLLTTPRKAEEPSDINERCTASPLCQRPRFCCCLFSAMNLEELQNSICNNVFLSNGWMLVGVANCYNTKTQLLTAQKNVQFKSSLAPPHCLQIMRNFSYRMVFPALLIILKCTTMRGPLVVIVWICFVYSDNKLKNQKSHGNSKLILIRVAVNTDFGQFGQH